jgi:hypothetical protein
MVGGALGLAGLALLGWVLLLRRGARSPTASE